MLYSKRKQNGILSIIMVLTMLVSIFAVPINGQAKKKTSDSFLLRGDVIREANRLLGAKTTSDKIKTIKDMKKSSKYYKDMAIALKAGIINAGSDKKLKAEKKATNLYAAKVLAKVTGIDADTVLGSRDPKKTLKKKTLDKWIRSLIPNVIGKSTKKIAKGNVIINKPDVILEDVTVTGNLIIGDGVMDKEVTLKNVIVKGKTIVRGGGENSIKIIGTSELSSVEIIQVNHKVSLKVKDDSKVKMVYIMDGSDDVILEGKMGTVNVIGSDIQVTAKSAEIDKVVLEGKGTALSTTEATKIGSVSVDKKAEGAKIETGEGTQITNVTIEAEGSKVSGKGKVETIEVNANNTMVNVPDSKVVVAEGVTGTDLSGKLQEDTEDNNSTPGGGNSGSSGNSGNNNGNNNGNTEDNRFTYEKDSRFAPDYPQVEMDKETGEFTLKIKLADGVASEDKPVEVYTVIDSINTWWGANTESVLHGHLGMVDTERHEGIHASRYDYCKIINNEEYTFTYDGSFIKNSSEEGINTYIVLKSEENTSKVPTRISFTKETAGSFLDETPPWPANAVINKEKNRIFIYFGELMDKTSIPDITAFKVTDSNAENLDETEYKVTRVSIEGDNWFNSHIVLDVEGLKESDINNLEVVYTQPEINPIQDLASQPNKTESFIRKVRSAELVCSEFIVSPSGKYAYIKLTPGISGHFTNNSEIFLNGKACTFRESMSADENSVTELCVYSETGEIASSYQLEIRSKKGIIMLNKADEPLPDTITFTDYSIAKDVRAINAFYKDDHYEPLVVNFDNQLSYFGCQACLFTLVVDGKSYVLRGWAYNYNAYGSAGKIVFQSGCLKHVDWSNAKSVKLIYHNDPKIVNRYDLLMSQAGEPINDFEIPVTIETAEN